MRKILYAEDNVLYRERVAKKLRSIGFEVVEVSSCGDAINALAEHPDLYVVIWDGSLKDGQSYNGAIQHFALNFKGVMIANSSDLTFNRRLLAAGCTHIITSNQIDNALKQESFVLKELLRKLNITPE